ncbi:MULTISPECIES: GNAT family N-acetyltransferase [Streptomyces]|uniref:GNAT family N-acetyltransferase n=2 Tax=Streptomyces TaxID=1883 RepID=A0ABV9IZ31_9ACTN
MTDSRQSRHSRSASHVPGLQGHGLALRAWEPDSAVDVDAWLRGHLDPEFRRWNTPIRTVSDAVGARESLKARSADTAVGTSVSFCITDADGGAILGQVSVHAIDRILSHGGVGYWVLPEARGRGVATRSLLLASRWAFDELGLHRLELGHGMGHDASCRIAERCGFRYEGTRRGAMWEPERRNAFRDVHGHGRLATDPEPAAP